MRICPIPATSRIQIEDGYWTKSDAAVVFRLIERATGRIRYIYHGNDGTSIPWNDTAQLNYLIPEVREAVIQTILHVARNFPDHPFRRRHDPGQEALPAPLVPDAAAWAAGSPPAPSTA